MTYRFLTPASLELRSAIVYYEEQSTGLGLRFLNHVEATIELILRHPEAWRSISENHRLCRVMKFPYGLIYAIDNDGIIFVATMHLHKHPDSWKKNIS